MSIERINAFDLISKAAILNGLLNVRGGCPCCLSCASSTPNPLTSKRTITVSLILFTKGKGANKGTLLCPCCTPLDNMVSGIDPGLLARRLNTFSLALTICMSSVLQNVSLPHLQDRRSNVGGPRAAIWAKNNDQHATFNKPLLSERTRTPECGPRTSNGT